MPRYGDRHDGCDYYWSNEATRLVVFVHGFTGSAGSSYWGRVPTLLRNDPALKHCDFLWLEYDTSNGLFPNWSSYFGWPRRMAEIDETQRLISDAITGCRQFAQYESISLFGHSLGCHLCIGAALEDYQTSLAKLSDFCLIAAPNKAPREAKMHRFFSRGGNSQVEFLADGDEIDASLRNGVSALRSRLKVGGIHSSKDNLVAYDPDLLFDEHRVIRAEHTWFRSVKNHADKNYAYLANWAARRTFEGC